jgi:hypothetical protein
MEFEPVYVAAPCARTSRGVSRRAFLTGVLGSLCVGSVVGARSGGARDTGAARAADAEAEPALPFVEDCVALVDAPLRELVADAPLFLVVSGATQDPRLIAGLERLAEAVIARHPAVAGQRGTLAAALAAEIAARPETRHSLADLLPALRAVR